MPVREYKRAERELTEQIISGLRRFWSSARTFLDYAMSKGTQRFTVMLIPHSVKKISTFQVSFFALLFGTSTLGILLVGFALLASQFNHTNEINRSLTRERDRSSKTLEGLKDEIASIRSSGKHVKTSIDGVLSAIDSRDTNRVPAPGLVAASFPALPDALSSGGDGARELSDLKTLSSLLGRASGSVNRATNALAVFRDLMASTPTTWPLKGGLGVITTRFGWTTNPFTKQGYMHTGVDIAWAQGTPIVATADGTIIQTGYTSDLGNFVMIQHKYGYSTRYSHLVAFADKRPRTRVSRGDVIGYLGTTGLSTGPHLDYVVRLGSSYINPMQFLAIRPENAATLAVTLRYGD